MLTKKGQCKVTRYNPTGSISNVKSYHPTTGHADMIADSKRHTELFKLGINTYTMIAHSNLNENECQFQLGNN